MKTKEELNKQKESSIDKEELESINGGGFSPTWIPVDEKCRVINQGTECGDPGMKGQCGNCRNCKHYN